MTRTRGRQSGMVAIETRYLGPTDTRGSRIVASIDGHLDAQGRPSRVTIPYPHELDSADAHMAAALELADRMTWAGTVELYGAATRTGYTFALLRPGGIAALERMDDR